MKEKHIKRKSSLHNIVRKEGMPKKPGILWPYIHALDIFWEFLKGFKFISSFDKSVTFFGSARESLPEQYYTDCEELAARLSTRGFAVVTGGSGGIMKAANRGAHRVDGVSVGVNIRIPNEQSYNRFLKHFRTFKYLFSRKTILSCASEVYIFFPGGFGTMDELFEMLTLIQINLMDRVPVVLYGKKFWEPVVTFLQDKLADTYKTISKEDMDLFVVMDSVNEAEQYIASMQLANTRWCRF